MTSDPRKAKQFGTKKEAAAAAKAIGWMAKDARRIEVMGFLMWAISDDHLQMVTPDEYLAMLAGLLPRQAPRDIDFDAIRVAMRANPIGPQ